MVPNYHDELDRVACVTKARQDNNVIDVLVWSMLKPKLYQDLSDRVCSMIKTRQDNNMIDLTDMVYIEMKTELS